MSSGRLTGPSWGERLTGTAPRSKVSIDPMRCGDVSTVSVVGIVLAVSWSSSACGGLITYDAEGGEGGVAVGNASAGGAATGVGTGDEAGGAEAGGGSSDGGIAGTGGRSASPGPGGSDTGGGSSGDGGVSGDGAGGAPPVLCASADFFDHDADPRTACVARSSCAPGSFVSDDGGTAADRQCTSCPPGTFGTLENAVACDSWTECLLPETEGAAGTSTSDRTCRPWTVQLGTAGLDGIAAVSVDQDGNVIVAGGVSGALPDQAHAGERDAFVRKYDRFGSELWTRQFGSIESDHASALSVDGLANIYVSGNTHGTLSGQESIGGVDAFLRKYNPQGTEIWTRQFGAIGTDVPHAMTIDGADDLYVCGHTLGERTKLTSGFMDVLLRKYDSAGNELYAQQFGSQSDDWCLGLAIDASNDLIMVGQTRGAFPAQTYLGTGNFFLRRHTPSGDELWTRDGGTVDSNEGNAVAVDGGGHIYVAGGASSEIPEEDWKSRDSLLQKYDAAGNLLWSMRSRTFGEDWATSVQVDQRSSVFLVGTVAFPERHTLVGKYDSDGLELWTQEIAASHPSAAAVSHDGHLYVVGSTDSALPGQTDFGASDGFLVRLGP